MRFTDEKGKAISNITGSATFAAYPKNNCTPRKYEPIAPFAEKYFTQRINEQPANLINYMLLADVHLRNLKLIEARNALTDALKKAPDNSLIRMKLLDVLNRHNDKTLYQEELEKIKQTDPQSSLVMQVNVKEFYENEKYEDCQAELDSVNYL